MGNLDFSAETNEVTASGGLGYILLYLDDKPSMRWRFDRTMKVKLVWENLGISSVVETGKAGSHTENKKLTTSSKQPHPLLSDVNQEPHKQHDSATSSPCQDTPRPFSTSLNGYTVASQQAPSESSQGKINTVTSSDDIEDDLGVTSLDEIDDDFGVTSDNDCMESNGCTSEMTYRTHKDMNSSSPEESCIGKTFEEIYGRGADFCVLCKQHYVSKAKHFAAPSKNLECPSCGYVCHSQADFIVHEHLFCKQKETGKIKLSRSFPCPVCGLKRTFQSLIMHVKRFHTKECVFSCCVCKKGLSNSRLLNEHLKTHLGIEGEKGKWRCSVCPAVFLNAGEFQRHSRTHKTVCVFCKKDFSFESILKQHYLDEHEDLLLSCRICGHRVATKRQLWTHERHHRYNKPLPCHICGKVFKVMKIHLAKHQRNLENDMKRRDKSDSNALSICTLNKDGQEKTNVDKLLCSMCPQTFPSEGFLVRHMATVHKQITGLKCPQCPKRFASRSTLISHIEGHLSKKTKRFVCSVCGKICRNNYYLKFHVRIHAPGKSFHCTLCGKGFNYKVTLNSHMKAKHRTDN